MSTVTRRPFNVQCSSCKHVWAPLYLPMLMLTAAKILKDAVCPKCACRDLFVAPASVPAPTNPPLTENPYD